MMSVLTFREQTVALVCLETSAEAIQRRNSAKKLAKLLEQEGGSLPAVFFMPKLLLKTSMNCPTRIDVSSFVMVEL